MKPGRHRRPRRFLLPVLGLGFVMLGTTVLYAVAGPDPAVSGRQRAQPTPLPSVPASPAVSAPTEPEGIITAWAARRSAAYADADPAALLALYTPGTQRGPEDVAALSAYQRRGVRLSELSFEVTSVRVLSHTADRWSLAVIGRTVPGRATLEGQSVVLPTPAFQCRRWLLVRWQGQWRVAGVRAFARCS